MGTRGAFGVVAVCLLLAACQDKGDRSASAETQLPKAPPAVAAVPVAPVRPEGADAVDAALAQLKAWNELAAAELETVGDSEAKIHAAAARALNAARGADSAAGARRTSLVAQVTAARKEVEAARVLAVDGQAKLRKEADEQVTAVDPVLTLCAASEAMMAYEGCKGLAAEHTLLLGNIEALGAGYQKVEAAYAAERTKIEEASAAAALVALQ